SPQKILTLIAFCSVLLAILALAQPQGSHFTQTMARETIAGCAEAKEAAPAPVALPGAGEKCWIGKEYYFIYSFDKKPKMGMVILKIQVFDQAGKRDTSMEITGNSGMPSMRGAHDSGDVSFQLNKRGDYLLPINIVMPGEWEVTLHFLKDKKPIYSGSFRFHV
ncbi:MAG TPA: hypothetical protein VGB21_01435, partial [Candidatus Methylomirabilis sp.]